MMAKNYDIIEARGSEHIATLHYLLSLLPFSLSSLCFPLLLPPPRPPVSARPRARLLGLRESCAHMLAENAGERCTGVEGGKGRLRRSRWTTRMGCAPALRSAACRLVSAVLRSPGLLWRMRLRRRR